MAAIYTYKIKVIFDKRRPECAYKEISSKYSGSKGKSDSFNFTQKHFTITARRHRKYDDGSILSSSENTLNTQFLKGVLFYCGVAQDMPYIQNITIDLYNERGHLLYSYKESQNFEQPLSLKGKKKFVFLPNQLVTLFASTSKASAIRIALSYWLKAVDSNSSYTKFDYLWRSFGRIYLYNANTTSDNTGQIEMRNLIISNATKFVNSIILANKISLADLVKFRWHKLILHDYRTINKMPALRDFVQRYSDGRIMQAINNSISVRMKYLTNYKDKNGNTLDLWTQPNGGINGHIQNHLNTKNDVEIITVLCIKYAYFLRNQYFHGEIPENTFRVKKSSEDQERELINQLLECLVYELIINNHLLRV